MKYSGQEMLPYPRLSTISYHTKVSGDKSEPFGLVASCQFHLLFLQVFEQLDFFIKSTDYFFAKQKLDYSVA